MGRDPGQRQAAEMPRTVWSGGHRGAGSGRTVCTLALPLAGQLVHVAVDGWHTALPAYGSAISVKGYSF